MRIALFPFDHAARPDFIAFSAESALEGRAKVRSKPIFLRIFRLPDWSIPAGTVIVPMIFAFRPPLLGRKIALR
jgi:Resolvase, N terminal domain